MLSRQLMILWHCTADQWVAIWFHTNCKCHETSSEAKITRSPAVPEKPRDALYYLEISICIKSHNNLSNCSLQMYTSSSYTWFRPWITLNDLEQTFKITKNFIKNSIPWAALLTSVMRWSEVKHGYQRWPYCSRIRRSRRDSQSDDHTAELLQCTFLPRTWTERQHTGLAVQDRL